MSTFVGLMDSPSGKGLLERFHRALFGPPALFWAAAFLSWVCAYPEAAIRVFHQAAELPAWMLALIGFVAAALLLFSAWISDMVRDDMYLWLGSPRWFAWASRVEARWPAWALRWGARFWKNKISTATNVWGELAQGERRGHEFDPTRAFSRAALDVWLHHLSQGNNPSPTAFGNVFRATEEYVRSRYGLDPIVVWPRLWLLLPGERNELDGRRRALDVAVDGVLFGALLLFLGVIVEILAVFGVSLALSSRLAAPLFIFGLLLAWFSYRLAVERAIQFAVLLRATFDISRLRLYDALGCPRPRPADEKEAGRQLSAFLWRGGVLPCSNGGASGVGRGEDVGAVEQGEKMGGNGEH